MTIMQERKKNPGPGRPKGVKAATEFAVAFRSLCPHCRSSDRERTGKPRVQKFGGTKNGEVYSHLIRCTCRCKSCGLPFVEFEYVNDPHETKVSESI